MLLIYTRRWKYKIEIITVHVQHAGLIFNADFFLFQYIFEYNQAGNKSMRCCINSPLPPPAWRVSRQKLNLHKVESFFWSFFSDYGPTCRMWVWCVAGCEARPACCFITMSSFLENKITKTTASTPSHTTYRLFKSCSLKGKKKREKKFISRSSSLKKKTVSSLQATNLQRCCDWSDTLHCSLYLSWHVDGEMIIWE